MDRQQPPPCNRCTVTQGRLVLLQRDGRRPPGWFVCPECRGEQKVFPTRAAVQKPENRAAR